MRSPTASPSLSHHPDVPRSSRPGRRLESRRYQAHTGASTYRRPPGRPGAPHASYPILARFTLTARRPCPAAPLLARHSLLALALGLLLAAWLPLCHGSPASPPDLSNAARAYREQLTTKVLPYWYDTAVDWARGGYVLSDDAAKPPRHATDKQIVTQARMVWGFAHAHRKGYRSDGRDYLKAAGQGYRFLLDHFLDRQHGGYYWKTDLDGTPVNDRKYLYGEAFVVYALVEYARASGDPAARQHALDLYRTIQRHCHDAAHSGWGEHYERDWRLITQQDSRIEVEVAGLKSANAHLHWMEALAELSDATQDRDVASSLSEALRLNATYFYPPDAGQSCFHRKPDWSFVSDPASAGLSYGHNVEFAWLMIRAEEVLRRPPSWSHFDRILDHALRYGYDHERGGLYNRGEGDQPARDTDKVWWSQSEMMAALTDGLRHQPNPAYRQALERLVTFLNTYQILEKDGIWIESVSADGRPKSTAKAHNWKANYHDVRALVKFIEAFEKPAP